uniref:G protein-coupled receptor n=1 Tax=Panagrellus redivivus TaxID=6233 RepID=A0A7E4W0K8_PANRE
MAIPAFLMFLRNVKRIMAPIVCPIGIVLNVILLTLIITKSPSQMKNFKKVFILTCVTELALAAFNLFFLQTMFHIDGIYYTFTDGVLGPVSRGLSLASHEVHVFFQYACLTNTAVVFTVRYLSVCHDINTSLLAFFPLFGVWWAIILVYVGFLTEIAIDTPDKPSIHTNLRTTEYWAWENSTDYYIADKSRFALYAYILAIPVTLISYFIVLVLAFLIWRKLHKLSSMMSAEQLRAHREITIVLFVEALVPFITPVFPVSLDVLSFVIPHMFSIDFNEISGLIFILSPPVTALSKLASIKPYRDTIFTVIYRAMGKQYVPAGRTTITVVSTVSRTPQSQQLFSVVKK